MEKELVRVPEEGLTNSVSNAEATIERANIILKLIAKHIRPTEIRLFGDNLHFERGACEKILMWAGAKIKHVRLDKDRIIDEKNEVYYDYEAWGTVEIDGREIELMGNCSTRSDFFGTTKDGYKPLSEVDIPSIKQAAITNLWNHACVRSLGLKSMTVEDLKLAGMDITKIGAVAFNKGGSGGSTITPEEKQQQVLMGNWLLEMNGGDKEAAANNLEKITGFGDVKGKRSPSDLKGKWLATSYGKVKVEYEKYCKENGMPLPVSSKQELPVIQQS